MEDLVQPAGSFEATTRAEGEVTALYARYVGAVASE